MICEHSPSELGGITCNVKCAPRLRLEATSASFFPPSNFLSEASATSGASSMSRGTSVSGEAFPTRVSQRWSPAAHYDARRPRRTYLRIMAIMLIIVSRAARASERRPGAAAFPRSGNGVCHHYGDRLTVNARYSFPLYASGRPLPPRSRETVEEGGCSREEGRSNERTQKHTLAGLARRHHPLPSAARRLRELPARGN